MKTETGISCVFSTHFTILAKNANLSRTRVGVLPTSMNKEGRESWMYVMECPF
jgi:hypothetical protein